MDLSVLGLLAIAVFIVVDIGLRLFAIGYIPNNRKPSEAMAWLIAIFFVPLLGFLIFLLLGHSKLSKKRRAKQQAINELIYEKTMHRAAIGQENYANKTLMGIAKLNTKLGSLPLVGGNSLVLLQDYKASIAQMTKRINEAKDYVHVEFYIMSLDKTTKDFFESLANAKKRGLTVRVLFDHIGSLQYPDYKKTLKYLENNDIDYQLMLPVQPLKGKFQRPDLRNHRKILVVDGQYGFSGSQNIIDSSYNKKKNLKRGLHWLELMFEAEGPVVNELDAIFIGDWHAETDELLETHMANMGKIRDRGDYDCQVVPSGPGFDGENNLKLFTSLMYVAKQKIIITSPYFVPDESMLIAITTAAERGVAVELYVSEVGDQLMVYHAQRSYYEALLKAGVRIFLYQSPVVLHAKHFTVDESICVIGTSNMDMRSFNLNLELSIMVNSHDFVAKMREIEAGYKANSKELTLGQWQGRPRKLKFIDNAARLTSSLQ
jgi:cardiolipin synthase A/B